MCQNPPFLGQPFSSSVFGVSRPQLGPLERARPERAPYVEQRAQLLLHDARRLLRDCLHAGVVARLARCIPEPSARGPYQVNGRHKADAETDVGSQRLIYEAVNCFVGAILKRSIFQNSKKGALVHHIPC